jgi:hypothetical protein
MRDKGQETRDKAERQGGEDKCVDGEREENEVLWKEEGRGCLTMLRRKGLRDHKEGGRGGERRGGGAERRGGERKRRGEEEEKGGTHIVNLRMREVGQHDGAWRGIRIIFRKFNFHVEYSSRVGCVLRS